MMLYVRKTKKDESEDERREKEGERREQDGKQEGWVVGYSETRGDPLTSSFLPFLFISVPYLTNPD